MRTPQPPIGDAEGQNFNRTPGFPAGSPDGTMPGEEGHLIGSDVAQNRNVGHSGYLTALSLVAAGALTVSSVFAAAHAEPVSARSPVLYAYPSLNYLKKHCSTSVSVDARHGPPIDSEDGLRLRRSSADKTFYWRVREGVRFVGVLAKYADGRQASAKADVLYGGTRSGHITDRASQASQRISSITVCGEEK